ncbi:MAG: uroporphyrinogen-III C-methyltransferase [Alphaproteobacteria bacterium]|nr:MAG: uroporphyrinogen-III C-methyltransferase [Alphaproteobacteria bacterium]
MDRRHEHVGRERQSEAAAAHLALSLRLGSAGVLIVGGGRAALAKLRLLREAAIPVVWWPAGAAIPALYELAGRDDEVRILDHQPQADDLAGVRLAILASGEAGRDAALAEHLRASGLLINVVDCPELSDVTIPALVLRPPLQIAISTGGGAPMLAARLRQRIEAALPADFGTIVTRLARWRRNWRYRKAEAQIIRRRLARLLDRIEGHPHTAGDGEVAIVGAGPGDAGLLTLEGARMLSRADVVLHDGLVGSDVLSLARREALIQNVAKRCGTKGRGQASIASLMIAHARQGRFVVRLKGGDPAVFARTMEEVRALSRARIAHRIVPGITAASAAAAAAGIALTTRGAADTVSLVTAHLAGGRTADLDGLVRSGRSLVFYMGVRAAEEIERQLLAAGLDPATPVLIAERIGLPHARRIRTPLHHLAATTRGEAVESPALLLVGGCAGEAMVDIEASGTRSPATARVRASA